MDHLWRFTVPDDPFTTFVAEPYSLYTDDLADLVYLQSLGWDILLWGAGLHNRRTIQVRLKLDVT